jgi:UDP-N-acetylmuramate-alanine ligase
MLAERMQHPGVLYIPDIAGAAAYLAEHVEPDDVVITMSAGDGNRVGQLLLDDLKARGGSE